MPNPSSLASDEEAGFVLPREDANRPVQECMQWSIEGAADHILANGNEKQKALALQIKHEAQLRLREIQG